MSERKSAISKGKHNRVLRDHQFHIGTGSRDVDVNVKRCRKCGNPLFLSSILPLCCLSRRCGGRQLGRAPSMLKMTGCVADSLNFLIMQFFH